MGKRPGIADNSILFRVLVSFFMSIVLFVHAPLQAEAASCSYTLAKSGVVSGSCTYAPAVIRLGFDTVWSAHPTSQTNVAYYRGSGFQHVSLEFPVSKVFPMAQNEDVPSVYDFYFLNLAGTITPNITTSISPNNVSSISIHNVSSYFVVECAGQKQEAVSGLSHYLRFEPYLGYHATLSIRIEFDVTYDGFALASVGGSNNGNGSFIGTVLVSPSYTITAGDLFGVTFVSTGEAMINSSINNLSTWLNTMLNSIFTKIGAESSAIQLVLNSNHAALISQLQKNNQDQIDAADKNADDIMHSYDKTVQDKDNECFEDSRKELQEQEDSLFESASSGFGSLDMGDYGIGKFSAMQGAFSFVSGFIQSCYVKMGDFGAVVTVGLVLLIATKVIGLFRFQVVEH